MGAVVDEMLLLRFRRLNIHVRLLQQDLDKEVVIAGNLHIHIAVTRTRFKLVLSQGDRYATFQYGTINPTVVGVLPQDILHLHR